MPAPPRPMRPKPPVIKTETVKCRCGHEAQFEWFADKQDKFRDDRRKKFAGRDCGACRARKDAEQKARARNKPKPDKKAGFVAYRLPDQAQFLATYDAASQTWTGTLTVDGTKFTDKRGGVFKLMHELGKKYLEAVEVLKAAQS